MEIATQECDFEDVRYIYAIDAEARAAVVWMRVDDDKVAIELLKYATYGFTGEGVTDLTQRMKLNKYDGEASKEVRIFVGQDVVLATFDVHLKEEVGV